MVKNPIAVDSQLSHAEKLVLTKLAHANIKDLIFLTVDDLLHRKTIISRKLMCDYNGTVQEFFFFKQHADSKTLKDHEAALLNPLKRNEWISSKEYGFFLSKFTTDPLMYTKDYDYLNIILSSLKKDGFLVTKKFLWFNRLRLTSMGESVNIEFKNFTPTLSKEHLELKEELESALESKRLLSRAPLALFNSYIYPKPVQHV